MFVLLFVTIVHVVATVPAAGTVDQVIDVVTSQLIYSLSDVSMDVGFMCPLVGFFVLDGTSTGFYTLGGASADVGYALSLLVSFVVFTVGAYRARQLVFPDHDGYSSDSTQPYSPTPSSHGYSSDSQSSDDSCPSDQRGPAEQWDYSSESPSPTPLQRWAASQRHKHSPSPPYSDESSSPTPSELAYFARRNAASLASGEYELVTSDDESAEEDEEIVRVLDTSLSPRAFRYARRYGHMAALLFLFTMAVPGDAAVLPEPAQYSLHHVTYYSAFFFVLGGAPAYLGTLMFSLLITILVFTFGAYYAYQHLHGWTAADNDAPPIGRRRLSAEEWAEQPFIKGVTNTCSVTVDGKRCGGDHRHVHCPRLLAAKAEHKRQKAIILLF
jgi:hypothetical protein